MAESQPLLGGDGRAGGDHGPSPPPETAVVDYGATDAMYAAQKALQADPPLTVGRKLAYALGCAPSALTNSCIGFFFSAFLLESAQIRPLAVSLILFGGRFWDAISDPVLGILSSRTNTRIGHLRPWLGGSIIPCAICYFFLWFIPESFSNTERIVYFVLVYLLFETLFSSYHVPYTALTMHLSDRPSDRDSATAYRMVAEVVFTLIASLFQNFLLDTLRDGDVPCRPCGTARSVNQDDAKAYKTAAGAMSACILLFGSIAFFGIREKPSSEEMIASRRRQTVCQNLRGVMKNRPYVLLTMMLMWSWSAVAIVQTNAVLYIKYVMDRESAFSYFLLCNVISIGIGVPFWGVVMSKVGKHKTYVFGILTNVPASLTFALVPADTPTGVLLVLSFIGGFGLAAAYLVPWAMLPDVLDEAELRTGRRMEAVFYSFFVFFQKLGTGVALAISTMALEVGGYKTDPCCDESQPESVSRVLRITSGYLTAGMVLLCLVFLYFYPLTTERCKEIKLALICKQRGLEDGGARASGAEDLDDGRAPGGKDMGGAAYQSTGPGAVGDSSPMGAPAADDPVALGAESILLEDSRPRAGSGGSGARQRLPWTGEGPGESGV